MIDTAPSSPSVVDGERDSAEREPTRGDEMAIGGDGTCPHPAVAVVSLGIGAPLHFERCQNCVAVLVTSLGDRRE